MSTGPVADDKPGLEEQAAMSLRSRANGTSFMVTVAAMHPKYPVNKPVRKSTVNRFYNRVMKYVPNRIRIAIENTVATIWKNPVLRTIVIVACVVVVISFVGGVYTSVYTPWTTCAQYAPVYATKMAEAVKAKPGLGTGELEQLAYEATKKHVLATTGGKMGLEVRQFSTFWRWYNLVPSPDFFAGLVRRMTGWLTGNGGMLESALGADGNLAVGVRLLGKMLALIGKWSLELSASVSGGVFTTWKLLSSGGMTAARLTGVTITG